MPLRMWASHSYTRIASTPLLFLPVTNSYNPSPALLCSTSNPGINDIRTDDLVGISGGCVYTCPYPCSCSCRPTTLLPMAYYTLLSLQLFQSRRLLLCQCPSQQHRCPLHLQYKGYKPITCFISYFLLVSQNDQGNDPIPLRRVDRS
jgi:hypothetical protein